MIKSLVYGILILASIQTSFSQTIVKMNKKMGVYKIPCLINGIKMNFILDTGAANVSISKTEANFLVKQGLLAAEDFIGIQNYKMADGSILEGTQIRLRKIEIQGVVVQNITATVIDNANAPLLLGLSALSKFGKFEIENDYLKIYPKNGEDEINYVELRSQIANNLNELLTSNFEQFSPSVLLDDENLIFSLNYQIERSDIILDEFVDFVSYAVLDYIVNSEPSYNAIDLFAKLKFEFKIQHIDKILELNRYLDNKSYHQLSYPINKESFISLIEKY